MLLLGVGAYIPVLWQGRLGRELELCTGWARGRAGRQSGGYGALPWPAPGVQICVGGGIVLFCMGIGE